jgi:hypothetical protein
MTIKINTPSSMLTSGDFSIIFDGNNAKKRIEKMIIR